MRKNAILFTKGDEWISCALIFEVSNTDSFYEAYKEIQHKLEHPETVSYVINENRLLYYLFNEDKSYKFSKTYWDNKLFYVFRNMIGNEVEYHLTADFVHYLQ